MEWGYKANAFEWADYNFIADAGMLIHHFYSRPNFNSNAFILAGIGLRTGRRFTTSLLSGFEGVQSGRRIVPLTLREKFYLNGYGNSGFCAYVDGGVGFAECFNNGVILAQKIGAGYSFDIGSGVGLNLMLSAQHVLDYPGQVFEEVMERFIYAPELTSCRKNILSFCMSIGLNF